MVELQFAQQVHPHEKENHDPEGQINFPVEDVPVICLVGDTEKLQSQCQLKETKDYLYRIQPSA